MATTAHRLQQASIDVAAGDGPIRDSVKLHGTACGRSASLHLLSCCSFREPACSNPQPTASFWSR